MKTLLLFLLLALPVRAGVSVADQPQGATSFGQPLLVEGTGPRVFCVYIPGSKNVPIESQGYLVIDGVFYLTGYAYAHAQLTGAEPHEQAITALKAPAAAKSNATP